MSAARPSSRAASKASLIRATPVATASAIELLQPGNRLSEVFVPAPTQAQEVESIRRIRSVSGGSGGAKKPGDRMGRLQRRQDPLQTRQLPKGAKRLGVRDRLVASAAGVPQVGVLGTDAGIVETGRDRVRLQDLPLVVLQDGRERPVKHPRAPG